MKTRAFTAILAAIALCAVSTAAMAQTGTRATFNVVKNWDDDNFDQDVTVHINCTTGDPISQSRTFNARQDPIEFIVKDFDSGQLDCEITEDGTDGYTPNFSANQGGVDSDDGIDGCRWFNISDDPATNEDPTFACAILNHLDQIRVWIGKEWIDDLAVENGSFFAARGDFDCDRTARNFPRPLGDLQFTDNNPAGGYYDQDYVDFWPHYDGSTCWVNEQETDSDIITDESDCQDMEFFPGYEADLDDDDNPIPECVLVNTRIYAGIPTLSEYGLALLALLMLGVGFVGYRRFA